METIDKIYSILKISKEALDGTYGEDDELQEMFSNPADAQIAMFRDAMEEIAYELDALITELVECELGDDNNG